MNLTQEDFDKLVMLKAAATGAWYRASVAQTDAADRRASRCQQALHEHCLELGVHEDAVDFVMSEAVGRLMQAPVDLRI